MEYRNIKGRDISLLGFGLMRLPRVAGDFAQIDFEASQTLIDHAIKRGVNYFDTAYTYGESEAVAGRILSRHPRESYNLATKCPPWMIQSPEDFDRIFSEQQARCQTDYFDFYLVHNMARESNRAAGNAEFFERFSELDIYETMKRKKTEGKIRNLGFSFHGTYEILQKLVDKYEWDFAQIQLNYIDWNATDAGRQYELLTKYNIPVTIMEPLRGGALATLNEKSAEVLKQADQEASLASWGIRYAASLPNVLTVLSGMNRMEDLEDNINTADSFKPVTEQEKELLYEAAKVYGKSGAIPCTGCAYCMPCPAGVNIPRIFSIYNHYKLVGFRIPFDNGYSTLAESEKASSCIGCGICAKNCPQHLDIPDYMQVINEFAKSKD